MPLPFVQYTSFTDSPGLREPSRTVWMEAGRGTDGTWCAVLLGSEAKDKFWRALRALMKSLVGFLLKSSFPYSMVPWAAALVLYANSLEMQIFRPTPYRLKQKLGQRPSNLCFNKSCPSFRCWLKLEDTAIRSKSHRQILSKGAVRSDLRFRKITNCNVWDRLGLGCNWRPAVANVHHYLIPVENSQWFRLPSSFISENRTSSYGKYFNNSFGFWKRNSTISVLHNSSLAHENIMRHTLDSVSELFSFITFYLPCAF